MEPKPHEITDEMIKDIGTRLYSNFDPDDIERFDLEGAQKIFIGLVGYPEFSLGAPGYIINQNFQKKVLEHAKVQDKIDLEKKISVFHENVQVENGSAVQSTMLLGSMLYLYNAIELYKHQVDKIRPEGESRPELQALIDWGKSLVNVGDENNSLDATLPDILDIKKLEEKFGLGVFYNFLLKDFSSKNRSIEEKKDVPISIGLFNMSFLEEPHFRKVFLRGSNAEKESIRNGIQLVHSLRHLRTRTHEALLDPNDEQHEALKKVVIENKDENSTYNYLATSYLADSDTFKSFYRKAWIKKGETGDTDLYGSIMQSIKRAFDESEFDTEMLMIEDIQTIINLDIKAVSSVTIEPHDTFLNSVIGMTSNKKFEIDPENVDWGGVVKPKRAILELGKDKPHEYKFSINYESELGEVLELKVNIDGKTMELDWNVLEDPAEIPEFSMQLFGIGEQLLRNAFEKATLKYEESHKPQPIARPDKKNKPHLQRQPHHGSGVHQTAKPRVLELGTPVDVGGQIKEVIIYPEYTVLKKMLKGFSSVDRGIILEDLRNFNKVGNKKLKQLKTPQKSGRKLHERKIQTKGAGIRVVVEQVESSKGLRSFEIVKIEDRDSIFDTNHKLEF